MVLIPYAYLLLVIGNRDRPGLGLEILISAQLFEKGLENWSFYEAKSRGHQGLGLVRAQLSKLRLDLLGLLDPSLALPAYVFLDCLY